MDWFGFTFPWFIDGSQIPMRGFKLSSAHRSMLLGSHQAWEVSDVLSDMSAWSAFRLCRFVDLICWELCWGLCRPWALRVERLVGDVMIGSGSSQQTMLVEPGCVFNVIGRQVLLQVQRMVTQSSNLHLGRFWMKSRLLVGTWFC